MKLFSFDSIVSSLLVALYFCLPLLFAHITDLFSFYLPIYPVYSYESVKVVFFLVLAGFFLVLTFIHQYQKILFRGSFLAIFVIISLSLGLSDYPDIALSGSDERLHGGMFFLGLLSFALGLQNIINPKMEAKIVMAVIYTLPPIFLYSIIQVLSLDPLFNSYTLTPFTRPIFATFGNAAYLAGYALLMLPIVFGSSLSRLLKIVFLLMIFLILFFTQSATALLLGVGYLMYRGWISSCYRWQYGCCITFIVLISVLFGRIVLATKIGSFMARSDIWSIAPSLMMSDPLHLIFGHGPDTLAVFLSGHSIDSLRPYIAEGGDLRSFHNIFLDILFEFGILGCIVFLGMIAHGLRTASTRWQVEMVVLFLLFFSLNIPSVSHWILLIFALVAGTHSLHKKSSNVVVS